MSMEATEETEKKRPGRKPAPRVLELYEEQESELATELGVSTENVELVPGTDDIIVFARTPAEMAKAQDSLCAWAARRIAKAQADLAIAEQNLEEAKETKIRTAGWKSQVRKYKKEERFYTKLKAALDMGYFIVPEFPVNIIGVRTHEDEASDRRDYTHRGSVDNEEHQELEIGAGDYVDPVPPVYSFNETIEKDGKPKEIQKWTASGSALRKMDFPFRLVRPHLLRDLKRATDARIFDAIAVMPGPQRRNRDPMLLGVIENRLGKFNVKRVLLLISWWIPTASL
jgi:hypothetical protein